MNFYLWDSPSPIFVILFLFKINSLRFFAWPNFSQAPGSSSRPIYALLVKSGFSENPDKVSLTRTPHPPYLIRFLIPHRPQVMSDHPGLSSTGLLSDRFSLSPSYPCCFLLVIFHPLPARHLLLVINSHLHVLYSNLSPISLPHCKIPLPCSLIYHDGEGKKVWIKSALRFLISVMEFVSLTNFGG